MKQYQFLPSLSKYFLSLGSIRWQRNYNCLAIVCVAMFQTKITDLEFPLGADANGERQQIVAVKLLTV
jgi:hypothetical protein